MLVSLCFFDRRSGKTKKDLVNRTALLEHIYTGTLVMETVDKGHFALQPAAPGSNLKLTCGMAKLEGWQTDHLPAHQSATLSSLLLRWVL